MVIVETKVKYASNSRIMKKIRNVWGWSHNYDASYNGRLWVCWDMSLLDVQVLQIDGQMIHMKVIRLSDNFACNCTAIYAYNAPLQRETLWDRLRNLEIHLPWVLLGDFNTVLYQDENIHGGMQVGVETKELQNLFSDLHIMDLHFTCNCITQCNKREGSARIYCKLDRVLVNDKWIQKVNSSHVDFPTNGSSDHFPSLVTIDNGEIFVPRPFKFCNMWVKNHCFLEVVAHAWSMQFSGCPMYVFMRK